MTNVTEWEETIIYFFKVPTSDGAVRGPCMRRKRADGTWEYRKMTPDEMHEYYSKDAW